MVFYDVEEKDILKWNDRLAIIKKLRKLRKKQSQMYMKLLNFYKDYGKFDDFIICSANNNSNRGCISAHK